MNLSRFLISSILLCWSLAGLGLGTDSDQPIEIEANSAEYRDDEGLTIWEGNVSLTQGSIMIQADRITVHSLEGKTNLLVAEGTPVNYIQTINIAGDLVIAESNHLEYDLQAAILTLTEGARLTQQGTTLSGNQIVYDVQRHVLRASSQGELSQERVRVTIPPANPPAQDAP